MTPIGIDTQSGRLHLKDKAPYRLRWRARDAAGDPEPLGLRQFTLTIYAKDAVIAVSNGTISSDAAGPFAAFALTGADASAARAARDPRYELAERHSDGKTPLMGGLVQVDATAPGVPGAIPSSEYDDVSWSASLQEIVVAKVGAAGPAPVIEVGTVTTSAAGSAAELTLTLVASDPPTYRLDAAFPRGDVGNPGPTPVLTIGSVQTGEPGAGAAATLGGTAANPVLNLFLPRGATGGVPALTIGSVTTGAAGTGAAASITGTAAAPVLNLVVPQGAGGGAGAMGPGGTQELFATYATAAAVVGALTLNQLVLVQADETQSGYTTIYRKTGPATLTLLGFASGPLSDLIDKTALLEASLFASLLDEDGMPILLEDLGNIYLEDAF